MIAGATIEAVTFDYWETLVRADGPSTRRARGRAVTEALRSAGHEVDAERLDEAFALVFARFNESWAANTQFTARHGGEAVADAIGVGSDVAARAAVVDAFVVGAADLDMRLTDHVEETLVALKERGIRLGIICDVGLTPSTVLRGYLADHGLLDLFDHWSFSDEVGAYKPDPQIFHHALAGLGGVPPARVAHVGDLLRTDVAGARAMGMTSVRYTGANDDAPSTDEQGSILPADGLAEASHVIADHADLLAVLGLD